MSARKMTPVMAYKNSNPGAPMPRAMMANPMDESKKHEMMPGDTKADTKEAKITSPAKPNPKAPLGQGGRFAALKQKLASKPGVTDPAALAASIGRKKFGAKKFNALATAGKACKTC